MGCNVHLWVEPQEFEEYCSRCHDMFEESGFCKVHKLQWTSSPSSTGSRNEILAWARRQGIETNLDAGRQRGLSWKIQRPHKTSNVGVKLLQEIEQFAIDHDIDMIGPREETDLSELAAPLMLRGCNIGSTLAST